MITPAPGTRVSASFRDPDGFVYTREGILYRQINEPYREEYEAFLQSGLYESLTRDGLLISHEEVDLSLALTEGACRVLRPQQLSFVSYPYEWSFSQLQDAALTTLELERRALEKGFSLKDCSAYNIQFSGGRPLLIDSLSFERVRSGEPWVAYRQFCQHFLGPLALMAHCDVRLSQLLRPFLDGIPVDLTHALLPRRTYVQFGLLSHIHLHAMSQKKFAGAATAGRRAMMSLMARQGLVDSLCSTVSKFRWKPQGTEWGEYYGDTNYSPESLEAKRQIVGEMLDALEPKPQTVWDLGANTGLFSRLAAERSIQTLAFDIDPAAVEKNYLQCRAQGQTHLLPLQLDLSNPSPGLGWRSTERMSLAERGPAGAILALALVHHLAISNNTPLEEIAAYFDTLSARLIIEFVPKEDSQVQRLLASREDIFPLYTQAGFEAAFGRYFENLRVESIPGTSRTLYSMKRR
ncbi:MAG: SAM-dependent methyltransferase [Candidatus Omnitrophica bacterium]|nr:SAM-dependent methyltransferase [Candidatus Omnitrophota bacterium]